MIKYNYAPKTAIGGRKENQDTEGSCITKFGFLSVVCDGMGGAAGGKTASLMAVNIIMQEVLNSQSSMPAQALMMAIKKANQEIYNRGRQQSELRGMGTTATALIINDEKATIAHAGDSRVYQLRDGKKVFRTNDHSKVFELVKRGILSEEQARLSEESNIIQRALGIAADVEVEINDNIPFLKGDLFMLCTDGVCGALPEENLLQLLKKEKDIKQLSESVIRQIDLLGNQQGGGHDNLTLAFVKPLSNSKLDVIIDMKTKITIYSLAATVALLALTVGYLLFSDRSKSQIAELQKAQAQSANDIAKLNKNLAVKDRYIDSLLKKYSPKFQNKVTINQPVVPRGTEGNIQEIDKIPKVTDVNGSGIQKGIKPQNTQKRNEESNPKQSDSQVNRVVKYVVEEIPDDQKSQGGQGRYILRKYMGKNSDNDENLQELIKLNDQINFEELHIGETKTIKLPSKTNK